MNYRVNIAAFFVCALTLGMSQSAFAGGAWSQEKGEFYAKISNTTLIGNKAFDLEGEAVDVGDFHLISLDYYAEVGLGRQWTIVSSGRPIGSARYDDRRGNYLGPLSIGLRRGFSLYGLQLGLEAAYGLQGINDRNLAPDDADFVFRPTVPTQHGQLEFAVGKGLSWGWVTGSAGAKVFSNESISPVILANVQAGYHITSKLSLDARVGLNQHTGDLEELNVTGAGETNYLGIGLGLSYWLSERVGLTVGAEGVAFAQSNASTPSLTVGVELR